MATTQEVKDAYLYNGEESDDDSLVVGELLNHHPRQGPLHWQAGLFEVVQKSDYDSLAAQVKEKDAEIKRLKDLAWSLDDYTIHTRNRCSYPSDCECGLKSLRDQLPEYSKEEIEAAKALAKVDGMAHCPNCKTEYACPCRDCVERFPNKKPWIRMNESQSSYDESCPTCGLTKDGNEWESLFVDQYLESEGKGDGSG